ncbi:MAG: DNA topoisomerase IV subunit A [Actinomycetales bacterium]|nr:DNA topoisomerase IV subunit A [Actinomycetales bacterium]
MTGENQFQERIQDIDLREEMQGSFLEYSYSVIYSRALPDARDGLKPVQRRIVYQMGEMGLRPDKGHVKSARVAGEVMGKLHPHGDSAIYDAMVRMAQPFTLRVPLIDGHGNFGSLDDGPAAARYTEARLSHAALLMNQDLDEDTVDFRPNYDAQLTEPEVLPAAFPNLLVNGSAGIAVGMATNMAPHNLREVVAAATHLLSNPHCTTEDLMEHLPGPDLPTGGIIVGLEGVREAYETGRGSFKTRARVAIETVSPRKQGIVVTELPYLVGPEKLIEKIKEGVNNKKLQGISDVTDLTDRNHGLRLIIELKTGFDPQSVLELLYRYTPLEDSFSINNVALVNGRPATLGLRDLLGVYLAHRIVVTRRRTKNRLGKRQARLHLVEGLLKAIVNIDEVIRIIRNSDEVDEARKGLMTSFSLSELQAEYILELRLRRLTKFSKIELESERDQLKAEIAELEHLLADDSALRALVASEMNEVADKYGDDRRTTLISESNQVVTTTSKKAAVSAELADTPCQVVLTASGMVARSGVATEAAGTGKRRKHDAIRASFASTTRSDVGFVTSKGRLLRIHVGDIPSSGEAFDPGMAANAKAFLGLPKDEHVLNMVELTETNQLALGTKQGVVKRVLADYPPKDEIELISLKPGDAVVGAAPATDADELVFVTSDAQLLHFAAEQVRPQGRPAGGMAGINLDAEASVIFFGVVTNRETATVLTAANASDVLPGTDPGSGKVSSLDEFPAKGRATGGVRAQRFIRSEDQLYFAYVGSDLAALALDGRPVDLPEELAKRDASGALLPNVIGSAGSLQQ